MNILSALGILPLIHYYSQIVGFLFNCVFASHHIKQCSIPIN